MARGSSRWAAPSLLRAGALPLPPRTLAYTASPAFSSHPPSPGPAGCHLPRPTSPRASVPRSHSSSRRRGAALQGLARRQRCHHPQASSRPAPALTQGPCWAETQPRHAAALGAEHPAEGTHRESAARAHAQRDQHSHPAPCPSPPRLGPQAHEEKAVRPEQGRAPRARGPRPHRRVTHPAQSCAACRAEEKRRHAACSAE